MVFRRKFPRVACELQVEYELVKWNDTNPRLSSSVFFTKSSDISVAGIGLSGIHELHKGQVKKLIAGDLKVKLSIRLYDSMPPITTFARFIWTGERGHETIKRSHCGCEFIDLPVTSFRAIDNFVKDSLQKADAHHSGEKKTPQAFI